MVSSRFAGIKPLLVQIEGADAQAADLHEGYRQVAGFISEWWPASFRNAGRHQIGTVADIKSVYPAGLNRNSQIAALQFFIGVLDEIVGNPPRVRFVFCKVALRREDEDTWTTICLRFHNGLRQLLSQPM